MYRLSETAGSARLSLVHSAEPDHATNVTRHETRHVRRGQVNCFIESRKSAPLNKSRSVGCCRSLVADNHRVPVPVSQRHFSRLVFADFKNPAVPFQGSYIIPSVLSCYDSSCYHRRKKQNQIMIVCCPLYWVINSLPYALVVTI